MCTWPMAVISGALLQPGHQVATLHFQSFLRMSDDGWRLTCKLSLLWKPLNARRKLDVYCLVFWSQPWSHRDSVALEEWPCSRGVRSAGGCCGVLRAGLGPAFQNNHATLLCLRMLARCFYKQRTRIQILSLSNQIVQYGDVCIVTVDPRGLADK